MCVTPWSHLSLQEVLTIGHEVAIRTCWINFIAFSDYLYFCDGWKLKHKLIFTQSGEENHFDSFTQQSHPSDVTHFKSTSVNL